MFSKLIFVKWFQGLVECLILIPIILAIGIFSMPSSWLWIWIGSLPVIFLAGLLSQSFFTGKKRWFYLLISLIIAAIIPLLLMNSAISIAVSWLIGVVAAYRGILCAQRSSRDFVPTLFLWLGLFIYFIAYFFYRYVPGMHAYLGWITWMGVLILGLTLFFTNNDHLKTATLSEDEKPVLARGLKVHNRLFILITFVLILVIANFWLLKNAFSRLVTTIIYWIIWFFSLFHSDHPHQAPAPQHHADLFMKQGKTSGFAVLMDKVLMVVVYIFLVAAAIFLIIFVVKKLKRQLKSAFSWLHTFLNQIFNHRDEDNQQYIDEKESVMSFKEWRKNHEHRLKNWLSNRWKLEPRWEDLQSNREKVRFLYRQRLLSLVREGRRLQPSDTPGETILDWKKHSPDDKEALDRLKDIYGQARYTEHEISEDQIKSIDSLRRGKSMRD